MKLTLQIWRQADKNAKGAFETYPLDGVSEHMSFLEMLDVLNEQLIGQGKEPVAFEHDCREGICGCCGFVINGSPHGPMPKTTVCQLHMRVFKDGDTLTLEPWRASAFPVLKDLVVDRSALDRIIQKGGYISVNTGNPQDANAVLVSKDCSDKSMDAAACIGCGACVAACPNASAMLFTSAKIAHLGLLPQGQPERHKRAQDMFEQHDAEGFGPCSQHGECEAACPKGIKMTNIAMANGDYLFSQLIWSPRTGPSADGG